MIIKYYDDNTGDEGYFARNKYFYTYKTKNILLAREFYNSVSAIKFINKIQCKDDKNKALRFEIIPSAKKLCATSINSINRRVLKPKSLIAQSFIPECINSEIKIFR